VESAVRIVLLALAASAAGCAGVQVRSVGTNTGQSAFDLTGPNLAVLGTEAGRLCPLGYAVMRQWQRSNRPPEAADASASAGAASNWVFSAGVLSYDLQPDQAQMSIACKG
jgi:hypothetical protein